MLTGYDVCDFKHIISQGSIIAWSYFDMTQPLQ